MSIVLVSDIFGLTPALKKIGETLNATQIVDPYDGQIMNFKDEAQAYAYFMENVGLEKYLVRLQKLITSTESMCTLIGFSIGAAAIWSLSENPAIKNVKRGICFYGAQIRHSQAITPLFDIQLIFPKKESHFDVSALQSRLSNKQKVETKQVAYLHGFMNLYSTNYSEIGYNEQMKWLGNLA